MSEPEPQVSLRRRADLAFAGLLGVGLAVLTAVVVLTGDWGLGLAYGVIPGLALGGLGRLRILRGRLIRPMRSSDTQDRGRA